MITINRKSVGLVRYNIDPITGIMNTLFINPLKFNKQKSKKRRTRK